MDISLPTFRGTRDGCRPFLESIVLLETPRPNYFWSISSNIDVYRDPNNAVVGPPSAELTAFD
jgi:hypothetical protein